MKSTDVERLSNECKHAANSYQAYVHSEGPPNHVVEHFDMRASPIGVTWGEMCSSRGL